MTSGPAAKLGDIITGTCVTMNTTYTGRVAEVIGPIAMPDCGGYRYRLTGTGRRYSSGAPIEPIVYFGAHATPAAPATREHYPRPDDGISPYDTCRHCGQAIRQHYVSGAWVTMQGANAECYGLSH